MCQGAVPLAILEEQVGTLRRVLGPSHPDTLDVLRELDRARMTLEDHYGKS